MNHLIDSLGSGLATHKFEVHETPGMDDLDVVRFWRRNTLNTNRAVAMVRLPEGTVDLPGYTHALKWKLMRQTKWFPFLYGLGLQLVVVGEELEDRFFLETHLKPCVDKIDNQFVIVQSIFAVDLHRETAGAAATWGQVFTGKFQRTIARSIQDAGFSFLSGKEHFS